MNSHGYHRIVCLIILSTLIFGRNQPVNATIGMSFTVNSTDDLIDYNPGDGICETHQGSGVCTLRAAILETNALEGADTINLPAGTYVLFAPGPDPDENDGYTGDMDIRDSVTIIGADPETTILDAKWLEDRILDVIDGFAYISAVTFQNGAKKNLDGGGGIRIPFIGPRLYLSNACLRWNITYGYGGAIKAVGALYLSNVLIEENEAHSASGIDSFIHLEMEDTSFLNNTAWSRATIMTSAAGIALINNTFLNQNFANECAGIYNSGSMVIQDSRFWYGHATNSKGGAICNLSGANIELDSDSFFHNSAISGGAIHNDLQGTIVGRNLDFSLNTSSESGGAINNYAGKVILQRTVFFRNESAYGGAIYNNDEFTLVDSTVMSNTVSDYGGGIDNTSSGYLLLQRVTVNSNQSDFGGGVSNFGLMQIENSTISGNTTAFNGGGFYDSGTGDLYNVTISENMAATSETGDGGGIFADLDSQFSLRNSILYGNYHLRSGNPLSDDCYGTITTQHYNLVGTLNNCTLDNDLGLDLINVDPMLTPLSDHGGTTQTHALNSGSSAIDAGNPTGCIDRLGILLFTDQRGFLRHQDGNADEMNRCDIGAFEYGDIMPFKHHIPVVFNNVHFWPP